MIRSAAVAIILLVVGSAAIYAYRIHNAAGAVNADAPVVAPLRLVERSGEAVIKLDSAGLANARLVLAPLRGGVDAGGVNLRAVVVADPDAMTIVRAPLAGRLSAPAGRSWPGYGDQLSRGVEIGTISDARPLSLTRSGTVTRVLARPGAVVQAGDPLLELTDFSRPVVSVAWDDGAPQRPPRSIALSIPNQSGQRRALLLGAAPEADPVTRRAAYLYRLTEGWAVARPGLLLTAELHEGARAAHGVVIPARALVQWEGLQWGWIKRGPGSFARLRAPTDRPVPGGWLADSPWKIGDSVVVTGAEQLLSEEFRAHVSVGDEVAE